MTTEILSCIIVCCAGILISLISIPFFLRNIILKKKCNSKTTGRVIDYKFKRLGNGEFYISPIAEFYADGNVFKAYRHYSGISNTKKISRMKYDDYNSDNIYISDNDIFHIVRNGNIHNYKQLAYQKWPVNSEITVFYNPKNPKQAFAEKIVVSSKVAGIVLLCVGLGISFVAASAAMLFML